MSLGKTFQEKYENFFKFFSHPKTITEIIDFIEKNKIPIESNYLRINLNMIDKNNLNILFYIIITSETDEDCLKKLKLLIEKYKVNYNIFDSISHRRLPYYTCVKGYLESTKYLIEKLNFNIQYIDSKEETLFFVAIRSYNIELVKYLDEKYPNWIFYPDSKYNSCIFNIFKREFTQLEDKKIKDILRYIICRGFDIDQKNKDNISFKDKCKYFQKENLLNEVIQEFSGDIKNIKNKNNKCLNINSQKLNNVIINNIVTKDINNKDSIGNLSNINNSDETYQLTNSHNNNIKNILEEKPKEFLENKIKINNINLHSPDSKNENFKPQIKVINNNINDNISEITNIISKNDNNDILTKKSYLNNNLKYNKKNENGLKSKLNDDIKINMDKIKCLNDNNINQKTKKILSINIIKTNNNENFYNNNIQIDNYLNIDNNEDINTSEENSIHDKISLKNNIINISTKKIFYDKNEIKNNNDINNFYDEDTKYINNRNKDDMESNNIARNENNINEEKNMKNILFNNNENERNKKNFCVFIQRKRNKLITEDNTIVNHLKSSDILKKYFNKYSK